MSFATKSGLLLMLHSLLDVLGIWQSLEMSKPILLIAYFIGVFFFLIGNDNPKNEDWRNNVRSKN